MEALAEATRPRVRSAVPRRHDQAPRGRLTMVEELFSRRRARARNRRSLRLRPTWTRDQRMEIDRMGAMLEGARAMRSSVTRWVGTSVMAVVTAGDNVPRPVGYAQQASAPAPDPRVGLKAGPRDAGDAARNMELVATLPKPSGFFDPKAPAGDTDTGPERTRSAKPAAGAAACDAAAARPPPSGLDFANSDLAFSARPRDARQLQRLQFLRHRESRSKPRLIVVGRVSRRSG